MLGFQWAQCRRVRPVLWDYASERLSEGPMELVEQHLQKCLACRAEVVTLQRAQQFLSACRAEEEPAPRSDWNALRQRIVEENVTPLPQAAFASAPIAAGQGAARRGLRPSWQMQLVTCTAGGFAAALASGRCLPAPRFHSACAAIHAAGDREQANQRSGKPSGCGEWEQRHVERCAKRQGKRRTIRRRGACAGCGARNAGCLPRDLTCSARSYCRCARKSGAGQYGSPRIQCGATA